MMKRFVGSVVFTFVFLCLCGSVFANQPKILKLEDLKPNTEAIGFSTFSGIEPEPFDVVLGEPMDYLELNLILARLSGGPMETPLEKIGPVAGMSGSPIFIECGGDDIALENKLSDCINYGVLVGALSYGMASFIEGGMNFLITPAEYMLGARNNGYSASYQLGQRFDEFIVDGRTFRNLLLFPQFTGLTGEIGSSSKCFDSAGHILKPGSMVSIYLAWGQIIIPASGTVTWVDGNRVYVFGHPLFGTGVIEYPFAHVKVLATLQTPLEPRKISGCYLDTEGVMITDGTYEVTGVIGAKTHLLPYQVEVHINGQVLTFLEEVSFSPVARPLLGALPSIWVKSILGNVSGASVIYWARVVVRNEPEIFLNEVNIPSQIELKESPFDTIFSRLNDTIYEVLVSHGLFKEIERVQIRIDLVTALNVWKEKTSFLSQTTAVPGEIVYVNIVLEKLLDGEVRQISIPIKVPDDYLDRVTLQDTSSITVMIQSNSEFKNEQEFKKNPKSPTELLKELNENLNRPNNVLYVQEITLKPKSVQEENKKKAKLAVKNLNQWTVLNESESGQLPSGNNFQILLTLTSPLDHYIDFNSTFIINVKPKNKPETDQRSKKQRNKWFPFIFW